MSNDTTIHYCTWARSVDSPELGIFLESARRAGVEVTVMPCRGLLQKPVVLSRFVASLPADDIVLCTDGYDVLYVQSEEAILSRFADFGAPLIFGGEKGCYHHFPSAREFFEQSGHGGAYRYLNSGLMIGFAGTVGSMLREVLAWKPDARREFAESPGTVGFFNDQTLYGRYASENPGSIAIDTEARLFWTMADEKYDIESHAEIGPDRIRNRHTGIEPCLVHVPHRKRSYLAYLQVAHKIGIPLAPDKVDIDLLGRLLDGTSRGAGADRVQIEPETAKCLEELRRQTAIPRQRCDRLAIIFIGTGRYIDYFEKYYETCKQLLLPGTPKTFFALTDQTQRLEAHGRNGDVVAVKIKAEKWPYSTLFRYRYLNEIREQLFAYSHVLYLDADMFVDSPISEEEFFSHDKPLFGVQHPGNLLRGHAPYETNPKSSATPMAGIDRSMYWQGCLWGGATRQVLDLAWLLARRVDDDLARGIIARWHDESHLNRYFAEHAPFVHTHHSGFAYPEMLEGKLAVEKKIVHIKKKHRRNPAKAALEEGGGIAPERGSGGGPPQLGNASVPVPAEGYALRCEENSFVVEAPDGRDVAVLNESGARIWQLCDGVRSLGELVEIVSAVHLVPAEVVRGDVFELVGELIGRDMIALAGAAGRAGKPGTSGKLCFYAFANNVAARQLKELKESAADQGILLRFLGEGVRRFDTRMKLTLLYEEVGRLPDDQIVCAVDGFDVFFCADAAAIEGKFRAMDCDCVISAERAYAHQYPRYKALFDRVRTESPYRYVNTGSIIGYAHALRKICAPTLATTFQSKMITPKSINQIKRWSSKLAEAAGWKGFDKNFIYSYVYYTDQQHVGKYVATNPDELRIELDHETELFWCTAWEWRDIRKHYRTGGNKIVNNHTGNAPMIVHVPG
ncbi:MAG: PqqD family peptide modification chaperone, partial [Candidatus Latescibacterota bacterium]